MSQITRPFTMISILLLLLLAGTTNGDESQCLQVGDSVPEFKCLDDQGQTWTLSDHIGQRMLVIYFYPSDFSFCCTRQALRYRDRLSDLQKGGAVVVGISCDTVQAHQAFKAAHMLTQTLLADKGGEVARKFGVPLRTGGKAMMSDVSGNAVLDETGKVIKYPREFTAARWTFIVGKDGRILYREMSVSPVQDSQAVLTFLRNGDVR